MFDRGVKQRLFFFEGIEDNIWIRKNRNLDILELKKKTDSFISMLDDLDNKYATELAALREHGPLKAHSEYYSEEVYFAIDSVERVRIGCSSRSGARSNPTLAIKIERYKNREKRILEAIRLYYDICNQLISDKLKEENITANIQTVTIEDRVLIFEKTYYSKQSTEFYWKFIAENEKIISF